MIEVDQSVPVLREDGNAAFRKGDWQGAADAYSDALEVAGPEGATISGGPCIGIALVLTFAWVGTSSPSRTPWPT